MVASEAHLHHLPLRPSRLIGRDRELIALGAALTTTRLLTLTGVGGVGKTRLALALGERVAGPFQKAPGSSISLR
jgi:MoxR-like ATPase